MMVFALAAAALAAVVSLCILWAWRSPATGPGAADDAEWQLLLAKRREIETDVTLSEATREALRGEWAQGADAVLQRAGAAGAAPPPHRQPAAFLLALVLVAAAAIYATTGRWDAPALQWSWPSAVAPREAQETPPPPGATHPGSTETLVERIAQLERRLQQSPNDLDGWVLLARSRRIQRDFAGSAQALERALALAPGHPDLLTDLADMLAMRDGQVLAGRPTALVDEALRASPQHPKGLSLAATAALQRGDQAAAAGYWRRLRATFPAGSPEVAQIDGVLAGLGPAGATALPSSPPAAARATAAAPVIEGTVQLAPALLAAAKQKPWPAAAMLFVVARMPNGPPMPVAALRVSPSALARGEAIAFRLDDSQAVMATQKLSALPQVDLEARVSLAGVAGRQRGDLVGVAPGVAVGRSGVRIVLATVVHE